LIGGRSTPLPVTEEPAVTVVGMENSLCLVKQTEIELRNL